MKTSALLMTMLVTILSLVATADAATAFDWDNDGLPDQWEARYSKTLELNTNGDPDADGANNLEEYYLGSSPLDANSNLRIVSHFADDQSLSVRYTRPSDLIVRADYSTDLNVWNKAPVIENQVEPEQGLLRLAIAPGTPLFLRLAAEPIQSNQPDTQFQPSIYKTFEAWELAVNHLPSNRSRGVFQYPPTETLPLKNYSQFQEALDAAFRLFKASPLGKQANWFGPPPNPSEFMDLDRAYFLQDARIPFLPFAEKRVLPAGSKVIFHGDFHGDVKSLVAQIRWLNDQGWMDGFKIIDPKVHLAYLGDYTDRGLYGIETVYTLLRLKIANPENVFMARGNHEEFTLNLSGGLLHEGRTKYGEDTFDAPKFWRFYDFLPPVLYIGNGEHFIQCCHGGMEPGYNPKELLKTEGNQRYQLIVGIMRNTFKQAYPGLLINADPMTSTYLNLNLKDFVPQGATAPSPLGFMWSDFTITRDEPGIAYNNGRSFIFGQNATSVVLEAASDEDVKLWSVFRAHQHSSLSNPIMRRLVASKGLFRHWQTVDSLQLHSLAINSLKARIEVQDERAIPQGSVWTFNVAPDSVYGTGLNYRFDAFGILTLTEDPKDWRVRIVNQAIKID